MAQPQPAVRRVKFLMRARGNFNSFTMSFPPIPHPKEGSG